MGDRRQETFTPFDTTTPHRNDLPTPQPSQSHHPAGSTGTAPSRTTPGRGTSCCRVFQSPGTRTQLPSRQPLMVPTKPQRNPEERGTDRSTPTPQQRLAPGSCREGNVRGQRAQPSPRGYSANGLGRAQLPCEPQSSAWSISARAWCSVPDVGTGKALKGPRQYGLQDTASTVLGHGASPWSSSRGPGACALMLAKLT